MKLQFLFPAVESSLPCPPRRLHVSPNSLPTDPRSLWKTWNLFFRPFSAVKSHSSLMAHGTVTAGWMCSAYPRLNLFLFHSHYNFNMNRRLDSGRHMPLWSAAEIYHSIERVVLQVYDSKWTVVKILPVSLYMHILMSAPLVLSPCCPSLTQAANLDSRAQNHHEVSHF